MFIFSSFAYFSWSIVSFFIIVLLTSHCHLLELLLAVVSYISLYNSCHCFSVYLCTCFILIAILIEISCGDFPVVPNTNTSATTSTGTTYEDTVTYACVTGYEITSGFDNITCQSNRRWSTPPTCTSECLKLEFAFFNIHSYTEPFWLLLI